jgi:hypothetical protein
VVIDWGGLVDAAQAANAMGASRMIASESRRMGAGARGSAVLPLYGKCRGSVRVNVLPTSTVLMIVMSPPIARARSRLIASPSPVPSC